MEYYLIDTNVVSDYLSASLPSNGIALMDEVINTNPTISIITQIELLCWDTDQVTNQAVKEFIEDSAVINITPDVIANCIVLRKNKKTKTPDAIIAATALAHNCILITNNEKDFDNIKNLKIINPHKI